VLAAGTDRFIHDRRIAPVASCPAAASRAPSGNPAVLIVTLDPWRDTPGRLGTIASGWGLTAGAHLLGGSVEEVEQALNRWKIPRVRSTATGDVIHPSVAYVVRPNGRLAFLVDGSRQAVEEALRRL
jgi:cytochrome oxidase Cu insertion factor (SCO1/SenC/PrrC family)